MICLNAVRHCRRALAQIFDAKSGFDLAIQHRKTLQNASDGNGFRSTRSIGAFFFALQGDSRITYDVLAAQVACRPSATLRRVSAWRSGRDRATWRWSRPSVGLGLTAYLNVRLEKHAEGTKRNPMDLFAPRCRPGGRWW